MEPKESETKHGERRRFSGSTGLLAALALGTTLLFWASSFPLIRVALDAYSPGQIALMRFAIASILLAVFVLPRRMGLPKRADLPGLLVAGLLGIFAYPVALGYGQQSVCSGPAAVLVESAPIFTALFAALFLRKRLRLREWVGILVAFFGVAVIAVGESDGDFGIAPGAPLLLVAAVTTSAYFVAQKPYLARYGALAVAFYTLLAGTAGLLVFAPGVPEAVRQASLEETLSVLYLGVFPSAVAYTTWAYALSKLSASKAASYLYLIPPLTFVIAWAFFGETPTALSVAGAAVTLAGVAAVQTFSRSNRRELKTG